MKFLVSTGYAWNRLRTLVLGLSGKLLILANNLNLRFVGNTTVITQQIRNAWDSYGLPFPQMLLNAAWLHNEPISDTEIVDETPGVDTSRPTHKARALQFNKAESVVVSDFQLCYSALSTWKVEFEFVHTYDGNAGYLFDTRYSNDGAQSPSNGAYIQFINNAFSVSGSGGGGITSQPLTVDVRYYGYLEFDGSVLRLFYKGDDGSTETLTANPTQQASGQNFYIGRRHDNTSLFKHLLGWMRITQDNIVTAEYAFEEGEGTICYNRVMNNFHGTINNATISTFRVEDVRITNGDQGTFLNTDGYRDNNKIYSSTDYFWQGAGCTIEADLSFQGKEGVKKVTFPAGTYSNATLQAFHNNALLNLRTTTTADDHTLTYYFPSGQQNNWFRLTSGDSIFQAVEDTWTTVSFSISTNDARVFMIDGDGDSNLDITTTQDVVIYIGDYVVTEPNVYVPRPRVTDIPLYNAGKYAYYIPDHSNNYIDLNTAFAGLTKEGDWMEFGIATVGTGEPDSESGSWATHTSGNSRFFANITSGVDFRFFGPNGGQNQMRTTVPSIDIPNNDFYSLKVTKTVDVPDGTSGNVGQLDLFDRNGNLIVSHNLSAGTLGNEGTYTFDRFFPSAYSTDFILAYLKLSDGTVWNGANDFNGGVNIINTGTGNVTKIFFESVDEDVLGNPLTYKGQVAQPLSLVNSNGIRFGAQEQIELTNDLTVSDFTEIAYVYFDSTLASGTFMRALFFYDTGSSSDGWVTIENNELRYGNSVTAGSQSAYGYTTIPNFLDTWQKVGISRTGSEIVIVVGDEVRTVDISAVAAGTNTFEAIGRFGNNPQGDLAWISFHSKGMTAEEIKAIDPYNMDTDSLEVFYAPSTGSGSTIYDLSGNNNHGTIQNATLSNFWIKQDQFHWNLKKGFDYYTRFADDVNQVQYNEELPALHQDQTYTIRTQFYFAGFPYPDALNRVESTLFSAKINSTQRFGIWIEGNNSNATFNVGYHDGSNYHTVLLLNPMKPGPYYLEIVKDSPGYDFTSITLNGDSIDVNQAGATLTYIIYQTGIGCRAVDATADRRWYGGIKFFEVVGEHYLSEDNGFVDTIGNLTLDVANTNISTQKDRIPYAPPGRTLSNPAGKWHNDAETEINFPHTANLHMINEQFNYKPFFYKDAQLDDATAAYSMRKVIPDYEGPLLNVIRSSDLQAQDFYPDSKGDLDTAAITNFVNDASPVLDDNSGAVSAYSLRKVRTAYTGDAIEVRRSSNGDTLDIGFDSNGDLDTTALTTFVNADVDVYTSDFSSTQDLGEFNGTGAAAQSVGGVDDAYKFTLSGGNVQHTTFAPANTLESGKSFTIVFDYYIPSGQTLSSIVFDNFGGSGAISGSLNVTDNWTTETINFTADGTRPRWWAGAFATNVNADGDVFYLKNIVVTQTTADGAVTTWYDQAGSSNATQSDPVKMPLVVSGGNVVTEGGKPAISLVDGQYFDNAGVDGYSRFDFFSVSKITDTVGMFLTFSTGGGKYSWVYGQGSVSQTIHSSFGTPTMYSNGVLQSLSDRNDVYNAYNGHKIITTLGGDTSSWTDGKFFAYSSPFGVSGTVQEIISYDTDQSSNRADIEANIGRYYTIDGFADGRVATWYDQANANDAKQATTDKQPLIVNDGILVTENSKPAIQFDGVDDVLMKPAFNGDAIVAGSSFIISVSSYRGDAVDTFNTICHVGGIEDSQTSLITIGYNQVGNALVSGKYLGAYLHKLGESSQINTQYLNTLDFGYSFDLYQNGVLATYNMNPSADVSSNVLSIGGGGSGNNHFLAGNTQELIIYDFNQSSNREDIEKNVADYYDITLSGNAGVESWIKNVSFADMYQSWFDYEYLHKLFANFEVPNQVNKILAYVTELTIEQRETIVYPYLKEDYHPIYTPYQQRVQADSGDTDAGKTNTLNKIDNI